jgi:hypothetical protein
MDQQALNGLCECYGVARQIVEEGGVTSRVARSNRLRITVEVHSVTLPPDLPVTVCFWISLMQTELPIINRLSQGRFSPESEVRSGVAFGW